MAKNHYSQKENNSFNHFHTCTVQCCVKIEIAKLRHFPTKILNSTTCTCPVWIRDESAKKVAALITLLHLCRRGMQVPQRIWLQNGTNCSFHWCSQLHASKREPHWWKHFQTWLFCRNNLIRHKKRHQGHTKRMQRYCVTKNKSSLTDTYLLVY